METDVIVVSESSAIDIKNSNDRDEMEYSTTPRLPTVEEGDQYSEAQSPETPIDDDKPDSSDVEAPAVVGENGGDQENLSSDDVMVSSIINNANNNFISSLDHLPCDIVRSLWLIQSLNFKLDRIKLELSGLVTRFVNLQKTTRENGTKYKHITDKINDFQTTKKDIIRLRNLLSQYSKELVSESKHLITKLKDHKNFIQDDLQNMIELENLRNYRFKDNRTWDGFNRFKRDFLTSLSDANGIQNFNKGDLIKNSNGSKPSTILKAPMPKNFREDTEEKELGIERKEKIRIRSVSVEPQDELNTSKLAKIKLSLNPNGNNHSTKLKSKRMSSIKVPRRSGNSGILIPTASPRSHKKKQPVNKLPTPSPEPTPEPIKEETPEETYCYCKGPSIGRMIACDDPRCKIEWFHYKCIGITVEPKGNWYCPDCTKRRNEELISNRNKVAKKKKRRRNGYW